MATQRRNATKKASSRTTQQKQLAPGALFRAPGIGVRPRFVNETGPCAQGTKFTVNSSTSTPLNFGKFQTLTIVRSFLFQLTYTAKFTKGATKTLYPSTLGPANIVTSFDVQFESAYSTFRLPGFLAQVMQQYRSIFAPNSRTAASRQGGANVLPSSNFGKTWNPNATHSQQPTPTFEFDTNGTKQTVRQLFEIPVSMYFDLYWTLNSVGQPAGPPVPRAVVSPQRMAATTRNVIPSVSLSTPLLSDNTLLGSVGKKSTDTTSAVATLDATVRWWRRGWIPSNNPLTEPPGRAWQYTRDYISFQPSGARDFAIPLDNDIPGQGQILSLVVGCWTPTLTNTMGAMVPSTKYTTVQLVLGSSIMLEQDTFASNAYKWAQLHGAVLPSGFFGWDYALTEEGKLTNEHAINTLVQAGAQTRIKFIQTFSPNSKATVYVGLEVLKKVGS